MSHLGGNGMPLCHRQLRTHSNIQFGMQPMSNPPDAYLGDLLHFWQMSNRVRDVPNDAWVSAIKEARENRRARFPDNPKNGHRNHYPDNSIYDRIAEPRPARSCQDG